MTVPEATPRSGRSLYEIVADSTVRDSKVIKQPWVVQTPTETKTLEVGPFAIDPDIFLKEARPHELTREMTEDEKAILLASIREHGVEDEIVLDISGRVIDGFNRISVCCKELLNNEEVPKVRTKIVEFRDMAAETEFVLLRNLARRHLTIEDKRNIVTVLLKAGSDDSDNAIASKVIFASGTVKKLRGSLEDNGVIERLTERRGQNGKYYPVDRKKKSSSAEKDSSRVPKQLPSSNAPEVLVIDQTESTPLHSDVTEEVASTLPTEQPGNLVADEPVGIVPTTEAFVENEATVSGPERSDGDKLLEAWWKSHGIDPVTSAHLVTLTRGDSDQPLSAQELKSAQTKIGVKVSGLMKSGDNRYSIQKLRLGSSTVYCIRPKAWSKHGPVN